MVGVGDVLPPNFAQVYGLNDVRIDGPARPSAYVELLASLRPSPVTLANSALLEKPGARLYDLLGVRYVLARPRLEVALPLAYRDSAVSIYRHPRPLPRLFLPPSATVFRGHAWSTWVRRPRDFAARALVSAPAPGASAPRWRARRARLATLAAARREPARWSARFGAPERRLLATGIFQDGGWRLLLDGQPHPTVLANGPLVGSWLPAGAHRLELLYRPQRFAAGCLLTALALAVAIVWVLPPPRHAGPATARS